jgi:hypothetical protein
MKPTVLSVSLVSLCIGILCLPVMALDKPAANAVKVSGAVRAVAGGRLNPKHATLKAGNRTYHLVLDEKGRSLVKVMHGQRAEIWGIPSEKDGNVRLQVLG